jgi:hypothetical protein
VAIYVALLNGLNAIEPLLSYVKARGRVPSIEGCIPAKEIVLDTCMKDAWRQLIEYAAWDTNADGHLSDAEVHHHRTPPNLFALLCSVARHASFDHYRRTGLAACIQLLVHNKPTSRSSTSNLLIEHVCLPSTLTHGCRPRLRRCHRHTDHHC